MIKKNPNLILKDYLYCYEKRNILDENVRSVATNLIVWKLCFNNQCYNIQYSINEFIFLKNCAVQNQKIAFFSTSMELTLWSQMAAIWLSGKVLFLPGNCTKPNLIWMLGLRHCGTIYPARAAQRVSDNRYN